MKRALCNLTAQPESLPVPPDFQLNEIGWLVTQAKRYNLRYLLAHTDGGVIWGEVRGVQLVLSGQVFEQFSPPLQAAALQQLRLFGAESELLLWRTETGFIARLITDKASESLDCLEERYLLWGNHPAQEQEQAGFFPLVEGRQGLKHTPPLQPYTDNKNNIRLRLSLTVRHYLAYDYEGQAYIKMSRLVTLNNNGGENG
jgi:CRISPR-associated protein (TIGR03984 family)